MLGTQLGGTVLAKFNPPALGDKWERKKREKKKDWQSRVCRDTWVGSSCHLRGVLVENPKNI